MRALVPCLLALLVAAPVAAQEPASDDAGLRVAAIAVCLDVDRETRSPVGDADAFTVDQGPLTCFTRIVGAAGETSVTHVWYHEGETRSRVHLPVRSPDWRTWSRKSLLPSWTGEWTVKVLDSDGLVLASRDFTITAAEVSE